MKPTRTLVFLLVLFFYSAANKCPEVCVLDDLDCVTRGGFRTYLNVIAGVKGLIDSMDPLFIEQLDGYYGPIKYDLRNITLRGLQNCVVTQLHLNLTTSTYWHYIECPKLVSTFTHESSELYPLRVNRKGIETITVGKYNIINNALYGVLVCDYDHQPHFFIQTATLKTKTELKGNLTAQFNNDSEDNENDDFCTKTHWTETEEFLISHIVKRAMQIFIDNLDIYCENYLMGEVLPQHLITIFNTTVYNITVTNK